MTPQLFQSQIAYLASNIYILMSLHCIQHLQEVNSVTSLNLLKPPETIAVIFEREFLYFLMKSFYCGFKQII